MFSGCPIYRCGIEADADDADTIPGAIIVEMDGGIIVHGGDSIFRDDPPPDAPLDSAIPNFRPGLANRLRFDQAGVSLHQTSHREVGKETVQIGTDVSSVEDLDRRMGRDRSEGSHAVSQHSIVSGCHAREGVKINLRPVARTNDDHRGTLTTKER
jgi:hypothetical protein